MHDLGLRSGVPPVSAISINSPLISQLFSLTYFSEHKITKAAPSFVRHAFPAVIIFPFSSMAGSLFSSFSLILSRIPSSLSHPSATLTTMSFKTHLSLASFASLWLLSIHSFISSRDIFSSAAVSSAPSNIAV